MNAYKGKRQFKLGINSQFTFLIAALLIVSLGAILMLSTAMQNERAQEEMLEKAQVLSQQMNAAWEFIEINQELIDTDSDGSYNFKGIYCAIAGKSIAARFTSVTDYEIRYISVTPRMQRALPDDFENEAYKAFSEGQIEKYGIAEYEGEDVFRYITPLYIKESCLQCHGEPAGEIDMTGYPKEGLKEGDIGGAISIIMPIQNYMAGVTDSTLRQVVWIFIIVVFLMIIMYYAVSRMIMKPLAQLKETATQIEEGNLSVSPGDIRATGEIRDLTRQFESMTQKLKSSYDSLESQVTIRTEQLEAANEILKQQRVELEQANTRLKYESEYKSDFLAIISHELRTPLTSILAFTEIWETLPTNKSAEEQEAVREIKENGQFLLQMINNILEAARLEAGKEELSFEEVDMVDLFGAVHDSVGFIADKRGIDFTTEIAPDVPIFESDWGKLRRILENLASNAIKFTKKNGHVGFAATFDSVRNEVVLEVHDDGIGIKEEDLPYIFDRFTQSDNSSYRRYKGSGLGLAVVKDLVVMLKGSIKVQSSHHQGSIFIVRIPIDCESSNTREGLE
jgi:signal transduction histidine kinase